MSRETLELVAKFAAAFNEGGIDAVAEFLDPDVEFSEPPEQPGATTFRGRENVIAGFGRWADAWASQRTAIERVVDVDDKVLVLTRETLRGRDGMEVEQPCGTVFVMRDGMIMSFASYWDQARAAEVAGLTE